MRSRWTCARSYCACCTSQPSSVPPKTSEPPCAACGLLDSAENPPVAHGGSEVFSSNSYLRDFLDDEASGMKFMGQRANACLSPPTDMDFKLRRGQAPAVSSCWPGRFLAHL